MSEKVCMNYCLEKPSPLIKKEHYKKRTDVKNWKGK